MGSDEAGTLTRIDSFAAEVIQPVIKKHGGRLIKEMGDGYLAEFSSVTKCIECAIAWQEAAENRAALVEAGEAIRFRVGINLGEVISKRGDVFGDGVNIAARLEALADPGGICVSKKVADETRQMETVRLEDIGNRKLKNIAEPVHVFMVSPTQQSLLAKPSSSAANSGLNRTVKLAAAAAIIIAVIGGGLWLQLRSPGIKPAQIANMAHPLPDKPSIAVLPFNNMSDDAAQEYFVDGMTEDLITDLSKISGLFVIARNSSFTYKGKAVETRQVAEELGVRYVLEGSVRRSNDRLRVNVQLIDAITGGHVWADRFDGTTANVFSVQDVFVARIVNALSLKLTDSAKQEIESGRTENVDARVAFQKGWELLSSLNADDNTRSLDHFKYAVKLDPEYGRAHAAIALAYLRADYFGWYRSIGHNWRQLHYDIVPAHLKQAEKHPTALVHVIEAFRHLYHGRTKEARTEAERALALQPSDPEAHIVMAWAMITIGNPEQGLRFVESAIRLNPAAPDHYALTEGIAYFSLGDLDKAAEVLTAATKRNPQAHELILPTASALAQLNRRDEARAELLRWRPGSNQHGLEQAIASYRFVFHWDTEHGYVRERLIDGIRLAALPLDTTVSSLVANLGNTNDFQRLGILRKIGWFGPLAASAVPKLIVLLTDERDELRKETINTLAKIGPAARQAVPTLETMKDEPLLGFYVRAALNRILGK